MADPDKTEKTTPEPAALSLQRLIDEAPYRFGVEPFVAAGALTSKFQGATMTVDRAEKLIKAFLTEEASMEVEA